MLKQFINKIDQFQTIVHAAQPNIDLIWQEFLTKPESFLHKYNATPIKTDKKTSLYRISLNQREYIIKRYNIYNYWYFLTHCLCLTRAKRSWDFANLLLSLHINTPRPILYLEKHFFGLRSTSYFVCEYIQSQSLLDIKLAGTINEKMATSVFHLLNKMWQNHIYHGDLKISNIIVKDDTAYLVDLDAMQLVTSKGLEKKAKQRDIERFIRNWRDSSWLDFFTKNTEN